MPAGVMVSAEVAGSEADMDPNLCPLCMAAAPAVRLAPCEHATCLDCSQNLVAWHASATEPVACPQCQLPIGTLEWVGVPV
jgi:hypothetical protein